jgi:hypothetical protein
VEGYFRSGVERGSLAEVRGAPPSGVSKVGASDSNTITRSNMEGANGNAGDRTRLSVDVFLSNRPVGNVVLEAEIHTKGWVRVT